MLWNILYFVIFSLTTINCSLYLKIIKCNENMINPVSNLVEEKIGNRFSLMCELMSTTNESQFDDQLLWIRENDDKNFYSKQLKLLDKLLKSNNESSRYTTREMNKSENKFYPLKEEDGGKYICISYKFKLRELVTVVAKPNSKLKEKQDLPLLFPHCNEHMFQCESNGLCIIKHYVCDGYADCKDGSDESISKCGIVACRNKIPCDDGRCIPSSWCCDKRHDPNCEVNIRHECCQKLPNSYEEAEYGFPNGNRNHYFSRYLFVLVCVITILFAIVLFLLIMSKLLIFAKKPALQANHQHRQHHRHHLRRDGDSGETIALRNPTNRNNCASCDIYFNNNNNNTRISIVNDSLDVRDPLLLNPSTFNVTIIDSIYDQPPSYVDIISNNTLSDPPPPYQSLDKLHDLHRNTSNDINKS